MGAGILHFLYQMEVTCCLAFSLCSLHLIICIISHVQVIKWVLLFPVCCSSVPICGQGPEAQATHYTIEPCYNCEFCNPAIAQFEGVTNHCRVELQVAICGLEFTEALHIQTFKSNETCIARASLLVMK